MRSIEPISIPGTHPALPGHFPGAPVVPGALLLDRIIAAVESAFDCTVSEIVSAKFHKPLRPETDVHVTVSGEVEDGAVTFRCALDGASIADGRLRLASPGTAQPRPR